MKIRLWDTEDECRRMAQLLIEAPGFDVVSVSEPRADHGASVLVRMYVEARIAPPVHVASTTETRPRGRRRALPPGGAR
jgi:hypothetical protein